MNVNVNEGHLVSLDQRQVIRVPVLPDVLPVVGVDHHPGQLDAPLQDPGPGLGGAPEGQVDILIGLPHIPIFRGNNFVESNVVQTTVVTLDINFREDFLTLLTSYNLSFGQRTEAVGRGDNPPPVDQRAAALNVPHRGQPDPEVNHPGPVAVLSRIAKFDQIPNIFGNWICI